MKLKTGDKISRLTGIREAPEGHIELKNHRTQPTGYAPKTHVVLERSWVPRTILRDYEGSVSQSGAKTGKGDAQMSCRFEELSVRKWHAVYVHAESEEKGMSFVEGIGGDRDFGWVPTDILSEPRRLQEEQQ